MGKQRSGDVGRVGSAWYERRSEDSMTVPEAIVEGAFVIGDKTVWAGIFVMIGLFLNGIFRR